jgi:hypothetical protein
MDIYSCGLLVSVPRTFTRWILTTLVILPRLFTLKLIPPVVPFPLNIQLICSTWYSTSPLEHSMCIANVNKLQNELLFFPLDALTCPTQIFLVPVIANCLTADQTPNFAVILNLLLHQSNLSRKTFCLYLLSTSRS